MKVYAVTADFLNSRKENRVLAIFKIKGDANNFAWIAKRFLDDIHTTESEYDRGYSHGRLREMTGIYMQPEDIRKVDIHFRVDEHEVR